MADRPGHQRQKSIADIFSETINARHDSPASPVAIDESSRPESFSAGVFATSPPTDDDPSFFPAKTFTAISAPGTSPPFYAPSATPQATTAAVKSDDSKALSFEVINLFHRKTHARDVNLEKLDELVKKVHGQGENMLRFYHQIATKGMIVFRVCLKELRGKLFLDELASIWRTFYRSILPILSFLFVSERNARPIALVIFRDVVILSKDILPLLQESFAKKLARPAGVRQMLLVLGSIRTGDEKETAIHSLVLPLYS